MVNHHNYINNFCFLCQGQDNIKLLGDRLAHGENKINQEDMNWFFDFQIQSHG